MLAPGTRLGPYEILAQLGAGGMGEVYRARDSRLGREIAIKVLPENLGMDASALSRFERETKAIAALSHPNIVAIHDVGDQDGIRYAVTELLEGETLRARINRGAIPWRAAVEIAASIADGLSSAHAKGIIHRDLKPENIFLAEDGRVKILDFGLAQTLQSFWPDDASPDNTHVQTQRGAIVGTLGYMSPEQLRGEPTDGATDIFSFGCLLFEMVTGQRAFQRPTAVETLSAILTSPPDELERLDQVVPPEVEQIVLRCLAKGKEERFLSARDLAGNIRAILSKSGSDAIPSDVMRKAARLQSTRLIDSIAVLPFVNASADPNADYLSDGITDAVIHSLARLPKLRVMASSTVFRYKGMDIDPMSVGRRLNVRAILTGRVVGAGDRLIINAELVDVRDGAQIWGEQYKWRMRDIVDLQHRVAEDIREKLKIRVTSTRKRRFAKRVTVDGEAYQLYLKGRYQWNRRTVEAIRAGIGYFEQAIEKDPTFALAWAGIADCFVTLATNVPLPADETMPRAKAAAKRALELDPDLAEAHVSLASVRWWHEWDRRKAETELRKAIRLNPNHALAHDVYSMLLASAGEIDRAIQSIDRACHLDPLSRIIGVHAGLPLLFDGRPAEAIRRFHQALDLDSSFIPALGWLGIALEKMGRYDEAISAFQHALLVNDVPLIRALMAHTLAVCGRESEARELLEQLESIARSRYVSPYDIAVIHAGLGETDRAFEWLEAACVDRSTWLVFLRVDPRLEPIRDDVRFAALLERTGL